MPHLCASVLLIALLSSVVASDSAPAKATSHTARQIEGWTVQVDDRLLDPANSPIAERAIRLLSNRLFDVTLAVPSNTLKRLQRVPIWLDLTHGALRQAQYHPSSEWLKEHGYSANLARSVHIPDAQEYASINHQRVQPWSILHELAHAYHHQVYGFDDKEISEAWKLFKAEEKHERVLHIGGKQTRHYGVTDPQEFFAEMSEAYFGTNDFFPFNRAELQQAYPEIFRLLQKLWESPGRES